LYTVIMTFISLKCVATLMWNFKPFTSFFPYLLTKWSNYQCCNLSVCRRMTSPSSGGGQMRGRKPALRSLQRQALAKQQAEEQQKRQRSLLETKTGGTTHHLLSTVTSLPSYHVSSTAHLCFALPTAVLDPQSLLASVEW